MDQIVPEPKPGEAGSIVNINCRFKREGVPTECDGRRAKIILNTPRPGNDVIGGGGRMTRYQCLTCDGVFHIAT